MVVSARFVDVELERARWRFTGAYRFWPRLQAGLEWNPNAAEVNPIGNYILTPETERSPMISVGTSSDRIGTPPGPQAYFVTFAKSVAPWRIGPYVSVNYSEHDKRLNLPFGVSYSPAPGWTTLLMNDGSKSHLLLTRAGPSWNVSLMWIWFKHIGISISGGLR